MPYLEEFKKRINNGDFSRFIQLWEEYVNGEVADFQEFKLILETIIRSDFAIGFGPYVETALPLWSTFTDLAQSYEILRLLIDLETTNSSFLHELAIKAVKQKYPNDPQFEQRIRLVGLRGMTDFQRSLSRYDLLAHMVKGNFVYHNGGWGTGEIVDVSLLREQVVLEFENVLGKKDMSFENAFKTLHPLPSDHFLSLRFGDPDRLEEEARKDPVLVIRHLLKDLGPKTAADIKHDLCDWVIPEADWSKWWQNARTKIKKDTLIENPAQPKDPFVLLETAYSHEERLQQEMMRAETVDQMVQTTYAFSRDFPNLLKNEEIKKPLIDKLLHQFSSSLKVEEELQLLLLLEDFFATKVPNHSLQDLVKNLREIHQVIERVPILALKKRLLVLIREARDDWKELFLQLLFRVEQNPLRDYILKELSTKEIIPQLEHRLEELINHPKAHPEALFWYFQKIAGKEDVLFSDKDGQCEFFDAFLILLHQIENEPKYKELTKRMYNLMVDQRYLVVRSILEGSSLDFIREFLLLITKCHTLSSEDLQILRSLAEVAHPTLATERPDVRKDEHVLWTTEAGFLKMRSRIEEISTVEVVENAREVEAARALGDLRENSEYKFAVERRSRLQNEIKLLSEQLGRARIITKDDISSEMVGVGSVVDLVNVNGDKVTYTILGPWDANPDDNILSFQSKLAQAMLGSKKGDQFSFRHENYRVENIRSCLK